MTSMDEVISVSYQCMTCDGKYTKKYDPPITYELYTEYRDRRDSDAFLCEKCNTPCQPIARFEESDATTKEPDPKPEIQKMASMEEWHSLLIQKYWTLKKTADDNFPGLWFSLEFQLSVKAILNIKNCTLPFIGIILGRPGSQKTLGIEQMRKEIYTYYTDNFTAKAFVSHSTAVKREQLEEIDMLPKIKNKLFLTPELSPTFAKKDDDLKEIIGIITRIADGHGYKSDSGAHGGRGYTGEWMFTWIGAAVDPAQCS